MVRIGLLWNPAGPAEKGQKVQEKLDRRLYTLTPQSWSLRPRACAGRAGLTEERRGGELEVWALLPLAGDSEKKLVLIPFLCTDCWAYQFISCC